MWVGGFRCLGVGGFPALHDVSGGRVSSCCSCPYQGGGGGGLVSLPCCPYDVAAVVAVCLPFVAGGLPCCPAGRYLLPISGRRVAAGLGVGGVGVGGVPSAAGRFSSGRRLIPSAADPVGVLFAAVFQFVTKKKNEKSDEKRQKKNNS